jgi:hypothetical protein
MMIYENVIPIFQTLMQNTNQKSSILKRCSWVISNIAAGSESQIQVVIDSGVMNTIFHLLSRSGNTERSDLGG